MSNLANDPVSPPNIDMVLATNAEGEDLDDEELHGGDDLFAQDGAEERGETVPAEEGLGEIVGADPEEAEGEAERARVLPDPGDPTPCQVEEHRASGHVPFRSWCRHCVEGRATGEQHRRRSGARTVCVFSFDYLFLDAAGNEVKRTQSTEEDAEDEDAVDADVKILVAKDSLGKAVFAHVVPQKGIDSKNYAVGLLINDLKWLG